MRHRSRPLRVALIVLLILPLLLSAATRADASVEEDGDAEAEGDAPADQDSGDAGVASILQASGLLDPLLADFISDGINEAADLDVRVVVLQVNSTGSVISDEELDELAQTIVDSEVPVTMWVGPSGARAQGVWVELAALMDRVGVAPGSRFGDAGERRLDERFGDLWAPHMEALETDTIGNTEALQLGIASFEAPIVRIFLAGLPEFGVEAETILRFDRLSLVAQQLHTVASPPVAYLLFIIGMALLVFEFYTAGVGVAGVVGAVMFLLGTFGLWVLSAELVGLALLVFAMFAFSVDVQTGVPRFWTIVGAIALLLGTLTLYGDGVSMSWIPMLVGVVGTTFMMVTGMPTMVRTRFSTPTIGREWMIDSVGNAVEAVDPDGVVEIHDALWRARTNRATPVPKGGEIRVVAVEGLVLEVEPAEGGARDYRERRSKQT